MINISLNYTKEKRSPPISVRYEVANRRGNKGITMLKGDPARHPLFGLDHRLEGYDLFFMIKREEGTFF
jgi:hypothetical protein